MLRFNIIINAMARKLTIDRNQSSKKNISAWTIATLLFALLMMMPIISVLFGIFSDTRAVWQHLITTVLGEYISNSLILMVGVGIGVSIVGTGCAWLVTMCQFRGRSIFQWALLLPLAAPAYILAYTYTELLEYYGPVQSTLRQWLGWKTAQDYWFPNVRSMPGAILMLVLVLYPYVYLLARSAFLNQSTITLEASRSLGCTPWQGFLKVALPMARPAIIAGLALALMETLNDYGTVEFFSVPTFTVGIFRTWLGQGERSAAMQLALLLLTFVAVLVICERQSRSRQRYYQTRSTREIQRYNLQNWHQWTAIGVCILPIVLGFGVPVGVLVSMIQGSTSAKNSNSNASDGDYGTATSGEFLANASDPFWSYATNSFTLASIAAAIVVIIAVVLAYSQRLQPSRLNRWAIQGATLGYAIPGAVIAIGAMVPLGKFDNALDDWMRSQFNISTGLLLSGTIFALVFAYLVRFLAVGYGAVESSLNNIKPNLDNAARSLGLNTLQTLWQIHLPLMRSGLISAAILVFVDVMKELPVTLIMRPLNYDTLAVRVFNLASDERLAEAALPALVIIGVGLLPVLVLSWQMGTRVKTDR
jgi:iron(III) transport system permease protein